MAENQINNPTNVSGHPIGMGEPVKEEAEKIKSAWDKFRDFAKTGKFKISALTAILLLIIGIAAAVILEIPRKPVPPITVPTPTPITFETPVPQTQLPPLSSEAAKLQKEAAGENYNDPDLVFPTVDWQITLQQKNP